MELSTLITPAFEMGQYIFVLSYPIGQYCAKFLIFYYAVTNNTQRIMKYVLSYLWYIFDVLRI
jgi:hypothetical protein